MFMFITLSTVVVTFFRLSHGKVPDFKSVFHLILLYLNKNNFFFDFNF
jgi:hypothetical protein